MAFLKSGDHILVVDSVYGPTRALSNGLLARYGITTTYYDPLIGPKIDELITMQRKSDSVDSESLDEDTCSTTQIKISRKLL